MAIDRGDKRVQLRDLANGTESWLAYDQLGLAPGVIPVRPSQPGIDDPRDSTLRSLQDMDRIEVVWW